MKVSVIVPRTEDYEKFFPEARASVRRQTMPVELISVLAGGGVGQATNEGVARAQTEYVMRLDSDDMLHENCCEIMANFLDARPSVGAVFSDFWACDEHGSIGTAHKNTTPPHPGCMMIRKRAYDIVGGFQDLPRQEGTDFYYRLARHHEVKLIALPLWYYRQHAGQMSRAHNEVVRARHDIRAQHDDETPKILAIIPARGGSKGIRRKNLVSLDGLPLVTHAIRMAKRSRHHLLIAVSTEDAEIAAVAEAEGVNLIRRDPADARDDVDLVTVAQHSMQQIDATGYEADIIVTIQPTAPYTPVEALDAALDRLAQDADLEAVVSVSEAHGKHPFRLYSRTGERTFTPFFPAQAESYLQRQDRGLAYQFTGGFYARRRHLLEQWAGEGFALGRWEGVTVSKREGIDIDTPLDLLVAQAIGGQDE